jgi:hypothetical protein
MTGTPPVDPAAAPAPVPRYEGKPLRAAPELMLLDRWEAFVDWLLAHTARFPKSLRFTITQRIENHVLDVTEMLVIARYQPKARAELLPSVNLIYERLRFLLRLTRRRGVLAANSFETAMRRLDECGRMTYGWRNARPKGGARNEATRAESESIDA